MVKKQQIRHFESEDMPVDVLLLLDVSGSMQPHIERLSEAAHQAMLVLGRGDRVGVMVFDRQTEAAAPIPKQSRSRRAGIELFSARKLSMAGPI